MVKILATIKDVVLEPLRDNHFPIVKVQQKIDYLGHELVKLGAKLIDAGRQGDAELSSEIEAEIEQTKQKVRKLNEIKRHSVNDKAGARRLYTDFLRT